MSDVDCPYCNEPQDIDHDAGYGYSEGETFEQQCSSCEKYFAFTTGVIYVYDAKRADCLNGGQHRMKPVVHAPVLFPDWKRCADCDHEIRGNMVDPFIDSPSP